MSAPVGIQKTETIAAYMKAVFVAELQGNAERVPLPNWSLDQLNILEECNYASKVLVQATKNLSECFWDLKIEISPQLNNKTGCMSWLMVDYLQVLRAGGKAVEENLLNNFPVKNTEMIDELCIVVDKDRKILLWYLPQIIGFKCRVSDFRRT